MSEKLTLPDEVRELFKQAGSRGGKTTAEKHGSSFFASISAKGAAKRAANRKKSQQSEKKDQQS